MDVKKIISFGLDERKATELYEKIEQYILDEVKTKTKQFEQQVLELKLNMAVERQLFMAKAKNIKAAKALIDFGKLNSKKIDEELIKQMIEEIKEDEETKFLFVEDEEDELKVKGFKPFETNLHNNKINRALSYEQLCKQYERGIY